MTEAEALIAKGRKQGFEEGREQGLEEGREQGRIDIVVGLLMTRFGPLPETLLAAIRMHPTGMTQLAHYAVTVATLAEFEQVV